LLPDGLDQRCHLLFVVGRGRHRWSYDQLKHRLDRQLRAFSASSSFMPMAPPIEGLYFSARHLAGYVDSSDPTGGGISAELPQSHYPWASISCTPTPPMAKSHVGYDNQRRRQ
jgi:hypothetical protein